MFPLQLDVNDRDACFAVVEKVKQHFGRIEIWINNAGTASARMNLWDVPPEMYDEVVRANVVRD